MMVMKTCTNLGKYFIEEAEWKKQRLKLYVFYGWNSEKNHKYTEEKGHGKKCLKMSSVAVLSAVVLDHVVIVFFFFFLFVGNFWWCGYFIIFAAHESLRSWYNPLFFSRGTMAQSSDATCSPTSKWQGQCWEPAPCLSVHLCRLL